MASEKDQNVSSAVLEALNDDKALRYIPVLIFLVIIMVVGTIGNSLVLYVYCRRFKKTSSNYFILSMAIFDLLACLIGLPTEIYDLGHSFTFYSTIVCKIFRYTESVVVYGSAIILIEIGIDRYYKICKPLTMVRISKIKCMCITAGVVAIVVAIPAAVLFGIARTETEVEGVYGHDCSVEEKYRRKTFAKAYYAVLGVVFVSTFLLLSGLYTRIWMEIKKRKSLVIGDQVSSPKEEMEMKFKYDQTKPLKKPKGKIKFIPSVSEDDSSGNVSPKRRTRIESIADAVQQIKVSRTTVILFAVTVAFVISYLPAVVIMVCRSTIKNLEERQSPVEDVLSKLFSKFYFLNNAINPVIYSFLNVNFRRRCVRLVKQLLLCKRREKRQIILIPEKIEGEKTRTLSERSNKSTKNEVL